MTHANLPPLPSCSGCGVTSTPDSMTAVFCLACIERERLGTPAALEAAARQALEALELLRSGLLQMREHAESYGEAWAKAHIKEYREMLPGAAEEQFRALNAMQHRLVDVAEGVIQGYDAINALREALEGKA